MTDVKLRPLVGPWPQAPTKPRKTHVFRAKWADTKRLLAFEADQLGARLVVVEFDVVGGETAFKVDGDLRANARPGPFPGVRVSMETRHGPLVYLTDRYEDEWVGQAPGWQANVRAVALSLQALRAVDRHGVSDRGEQYVGWKALPAGTGRATAGPGGAVELAAAAPMTRERAARTLADLTGNPHPDQLAEDMLAELAVAKGVYRQLARRLHPDTGGSRDLWDMVAAAWAVLEEGAPTDGGER